MRRLLLPCLVLAVAVPLAACGGDAEEPAAAAPDVTTASATVDAPETSAAASRRAARRGRARRRLRRGRTIKVVDSQFGAVVADVTGEAVYLFDLERTKRPRCYGDCAAAWPPVLAKGRPVAGRGIRRRLLGTVRRRDGRLQVTYRGHPLYYYVHDAPGRILCHDVFEFGGLWLVVAPNGNARS